MMCAGDERSHVRVFSQGIIAMRPRSAALTCAVLLFSTLSGRLVAGDDAPVNQPGAFEVDEVTYPIRAPDKAVVKDVVYSLEGQETRLFLTSQPLDGADPQLKRVAVKFTVPEGAGVVELALAKL